MSSTRQKITNYIDFKSVNVLVLPEDTILSATPIVYNRSKLYRSPQINIFILKLFFRSLKRWWYGKIAVLKIGIGLICTNKITNSGGEEGIRTLDTIAREHAFQAGALNRSATSP